MEKSTDPSVVKGRWPRLFLDLQRDFKLWLLCVLLLQISRVVLIVLFRHRLAETTGLRDTVLCILGGLRFDLVVAGYVAVVPVAVSVLGAALGFRRPQGIVRGIFMGVFIGITLPMCLVSYGFFREFDDVFNERIFGLIYDDQAATWASVASEYESLVPILLLLTAAVTGFVIWRGLKWLKKPIFSEETSRRLLSRRPARVGLAVLVLFFVVVSVRGKVGRSGVDLKDAGITTDTTLNKLTVNGYMALKIAIVRWQHLAGASGIEVFFPEEEIRDRLGLLYPDAEPSDDLDDYFVRTAGGPPGDAPRHVFLILVESLSCWPLLDEYESFGLADDLKQLGEEGVVIKHFLSASTSSMTSLAAIFTGLPDAGVFTNYEPRSRQPYPTSIAPIFRRLGYRTRLFTGGYLTWQRIGEFAENQGFDEAYGAAHIVGGQRDPWGVDNRSLFDLVLRTVTDDTPSFNVIFTVSNHPPYTVDLESEGLVVAEVPEDLLPRIDPAIRNRGSMKHFLRKAGHYRYAQKTSVDFVRAAGERLGPIAVAITGDHVGRVYLSATPTLFEKSSVPCVLFGTGVPARGSVDGIVGSHLDIGPTLVELVAPEGFRYHAVGRDLLGDERTGLAFGKDSLLGRNFVFEMQATPVIEGIPESQVPFEDQDVERLTRLHRTFTGVGWWRIMRGERLPEPQPRGER